MASRKRRLPQEVFLSHASADRPYVDAIAATLRAHGIRVWYSTIHIKGAQQWHDDIGRALNRCDWFLLLLSKAAVKSSWVKRELLFALNAKRYEERIVPVAITDCDWRRLSWTLDALQILSLQQGFVPGCRAILAVWGSSLDESSVTLPSRLTRLRRKSGRPPAGPGSK